MGNLWVIIQTHLDRYGVREAAFARRLGTAPQTLNSWKKRGLKQLPDRELLEAVARETSTAYEDVLDAVLRDINYKDPVETLSEASDPIAPNTKDHALAAREDDDDDEEAAAQANEP